MWFWEENNGRTERRTGDPHLGDAGGCQPGRRHFRRLGDLANGYRRWRSRVGPGPRPVATVAVTGFTFHKPVKIGDVVCCYADIQKVGNSSITIGLEAWALHRDDSKDRIKVTEGVFTFVALDKDGNPRTVPPE